MEEEKGEGGDRGGVQGGGAKEGRGGESRYSRGQVVDKIRGWSGSCDDGRTKGGVKERAEGGS